MTELSPNQIFDLVRELNVLDADRRVSAALAIGNLSTVSPKIIQKLIIVSEQDMSLKVRDAAKQALLSIEQRQKVISSMPFDQEPQVNQDIPVENMSQEDLVREQVRMLRRVSEKLDYLSQLVNISSKGSKETKVSDINMSIGSMITFTFKWFIASIPIGIILLFVYLVLIKMLIR